MPQEARVLPPDLSEPQRHSITTLAFLQAYPTLEAAKGATVEEIALLLRQQRHPQPQLQADPVITRTKSRLMLVLAQKLALLEEQIKAYDQEIHRFLVLHPNNSLFCSLPGAARRLTPRLLAEWGDDRERYVAAGSIQALAGTSPVAYQSGNYRNIHKRYACVKPLRNALHQFAWQSNLILPLKDWAGEFYQRKRAEGESHSMAVRALANLWVRIIYAMCAMWLKHELYNASTFLAARQAHDRVAT